METAGLFHGQSRHQRRGAAHVLLAAMLFAFLVAAAWMVDVAYMQLIRTELRSATDAAAKAGAEALTRFQSDKEAKDAAVLYASLNKVGGQPFKIKHSDVTLGRVTGQPDGTWMFAAHEKPYNSVRVNSQIGNGGTTKAIPLFFGTALGHGNFATSQQATASQQEVEVCLCLDRSGSMMFDMSGVEYEYASNNPKLFASNYYPSTMWRNFCSPPHPTESRWAALMTAIDVFLDEAGKFSYPPRTSLVTWSSAYTLPYYPFSSYTTVTTDWSLPGQANFSWSMNRTHIESALAARTIAPVVGGTTLSAGLDQAVADLTSGNGRPLSSKVIILLTDGDWNAGRDPVLAAQDAAAAGITVHCVSMLTGTQPTLTQVASITGGKYYATTNAADLQQAFQDLARSLPIVLTD